MHADWEQEFSVVRFYGDKAKADAVYAWVYMLFTGEVLTDDFILVTASH